MQRPKPGETEEDILKLQEEFLRNPKKNQAANVVNVGNPKRQSQFARSRQSSAAIPPASGPLEQLQDLHEALPATETITDPTNQEDIVLLRVVERDVLPCQSSDSRVADDFAFPAVDVTPLPVAQPQQGRSLFAIAKEAQTSATKGECGNAVAKPKSVAMEWNDESQGQGEVGSDALAQQIHNENLQYLQKQDPKQIMASRNELLSKLDPKTIEFLKKRRQASGPSPLAKQTPEKSPLVDAPAAPALSLDHLLSQGNAAAEIIAASGSEKWIHFDGLELDKLQWLSDIPQPTESDGSGLYEARFNWEGRLMPYSLPEGRLADGIQIDQRDLYLHGDEPHRPGYSLQELFRFARSSVYMQRVAAFECLIGIVSYYSRGYYDEILQLPITKLFFLARFGCDDNLPQIVTLSFFLMATLVYSDTDEDLLDFLYENPGGHVQPSLEVSSEDTTPVILSVLLKTDVDYDPRDMDGVPKDAMDDFALAETDLVGCLMRTRILERISYVLAHEIYDSVVPACLKILIRLARKSEEFALRIASDTALIQQLYTLFLVPFYSLNDINDSAKAPNRGYPQRLCLKLMRVLVAQSDKAAFLLLRLGLVERIRGHMYTSHDLSANLIEVQIEGLRVLHTLAMRPVNFESHFLDESLHYYLLKHLNETNFLKGGYLLRQHAAAIINVLLAIQNRTNTLDERFVKVMRDCCHKWLHQVASADGSPREFTQVTLLAVVLQAVESCRSKFFAEDGKSLADLLNKVFGSSCFLGCVRNLNNTSTVLNKNNTNRHSIYRPLPNVGSIARGSRGPELIITQVYPFYLLATAISLTEAMHGRHGCCTTRQLLSLVGDERVGDYVKRFITATNDELSRNFFAKKELELLFRMQSSPMLQEILAAEDIFLASFKLVTSGTADFVMLLHQLLRDVILSPSYLLVERDTVQVWLNTYQGILPVVEEEQPSQQFRDTVLPASGRSLLPKDWPYIFMQKIYSCFLSNAKSCLEDAEVIKMTFTLTTAIDKRCPGMNLVTPEQKLMYLMIAFMSANCDFLQQDVYEVLLHTVQLFYAQYSDYMFDFDKAALGEYKFENLYYLFVNHYQAVSYGDKLFGSVVMIPLAQRHPKKWRMRVWSELAYIFSSFNCSDMLMGGLEAYVEPLEEDESMIVAYHKALCNMRLAPLPRTIAEKHVLAHKKRFGRLPAL